MTPASQKNFFQLSHTHRDWGGFLKRNLTDGRSRQIPLSRLLQGWRRGFDSEYILLFGLNDSNWDHYLPDLHRYRFSLGTNHHVWPFLHDKLMFNYFMRDRLRVIEMLFWISEGVFNQGMPDWTLERFFAECRQGGRFVLKAAHGGTGLGLHFVQGGDDLLVNGKPVGQDEFRRFITSLPYHLCYPMMDTHPVLKAVFPNAGNALRVTAFVGLDGKPRLLAPALCLGTSKSAPVEHFRYGGLVATIDEASGVCVKVYSRGKDGGLERIERHPDTGASLMGLEVPYWSEIREAILGFHRDHPAFDLVGWDVLVAADGYRVIEGNHNPALRIPLMNRNLSEEPEFVAFLKARGLLGS